MKKVMIFLLVILVFINPIWLILFLIKKRCVDKKDICISESMFGREFIFEIKDNKTTFSIYNLDFKYKTRINYSKPI